jgi:hypothetical protein
MVPGMIVWGIALSGLFTTPRRAALDAVPTEKAGETGGILMTMQLLGGTLGVALGTTVYALTDRFELIYVLNSGLLAVTLFVIWRWMHAPEVAPPIPVSPGPPPA